ncbi:MAG: acetate--CoA ligase family protein, partial [Pseudomonadota bacterium]
SFEAALRAIGTAARQTGAPIFAVSSMPEGLDEGVAQAFSDDGVAALGGLETALAAVDAAATPPGQAGWAPWPNTETRTTRILEESTAKLRLAKAGIAVPKGVTAATLGELVTASRELCAPLALKGLGFAHKTEAGAVRLNLGDLEHAEPMPGASGYLAEEMVPGGLAELILGVRRDPVYGASLTLGLGGVAAELLADVATLVLPTSIEEITGAFRELQLWPLLDGHRGRPRPALQGAIEVALVLQDMLATMPEIEEIEINPLILTATRAVAADALIREAAP